MGHSNDESEADLSESKLDDYIYRIQGNLVTTTKSLVPNTIETKATQFEEMQTKLRHAPASLNRVVQEKDAMTQDLHNEMASLEQKRTDEKMLALAELHKREKEDLHKKIFDLQKEKDQRQAQLEVAVQLMKRMGGGADPRKIMDEVEDELKEKEEELEAMEALNQALIIKERRSDYELQEARKELVNGLKDGTTVRADIGVKWMGLLDENVFRIAAKAKFPTQEAPTKAKELILLWRTYMEDHNWHPFKVVRDNGVVKEVINEEDERLQSLRNELGEKACKAVMTVMTELNEYNPSGLFSVPELWNFKDNRKATVKEGAVYILNQLRTCMKNRNCD